MWIFLNNDNLDIRNKVFKFSECSLDMIQIFCNVPMELSNKVLYQIDLSHVEHRSLDLFEYFIFLTAFLYSKWVVSNASCPEKYSEKYFESNDFKNNISRVSWFHLDYIKLNIAHKGYHGYFELCWIFFSIKDTIAILNHITIYVERKSRI